MHTQPKTPTPLRSSRRVLGIALTALLLIAGWTPAWAETETFGDNGELLRVLAGRYENLFGQNGPSPGTDPKSVVMALEITTPDGKRLRHLVPGTDGAETELQPSLTHDKGQIFLLWASRVDRHRSLMNVIGFDGETWTEVIEVSGDPVPFKGPPRVAVTRDAYGSAAAPAQRTILHLVWWESRQGALIVFYSPITLLDGEFIGWNPVIALNQFDVHSPESEGPIAANHRNVALYKAANVELGADGRTVVVGLPQFDKQRIQSLRMHVIPAALNLLADDVRSHIIGAGRGRQRASILGLGDEVRSHIIGAGATLHRGVLQYIADQVYMSILEHGAAYDPDDLADIAHRAWLTALESGGSLLSGAEADGLPCNLLHVAEDSEGRSDHQIEVCLMSDRPVPETGEGSHTLLVSESGLEALIVWKDASGDLHYIESDGSDGWDETHSLNIGGALSADRALRVLKQQARNR